MYEYKGTETMMQKNYRKMQCCIKIQKGTKNAELWQALWK